MRTRTQCVFICFIFAVLWLAKGKEHEVFVDTATIPLALASEICRNSGNKCTKLVRPLIELQKFSLFNSELKDWTHNEACGCHMPPQLKLPNLQYFHVPKCGTSINWFLIDYFDDCGRIEAVHSPRQEPCPRWLQNVRITVELYSCCCMSLLVQRMRVLSKGRAAVTRTL